MAPLPKQSIPVNNLLGHSLSRNLVFDTTSKPCTRHGFETSLQEARSCLLVFHCYDSVQLCSGGPRKCISSSKVPTSSAPRASRKSIFVHPRGKCSAFNVAEPLAGAGRNKTLVELGDVLKGSRASMSRLGDFGGI